MFVRKKKKKKKEGRGWRVGFQEKARLVVQKNTGIRNGNFYAIYIEMVAKDLPKLFPPLMIFIWKNCVLWDNNQF